VKGFIPRVVVYCRRSPVVGLNETTKTTHAKSQRREAAQSENGFFDFTNFAYFAPLLESALFVA